MVPQPGMLIVTLLITGSARLRSSRLMFQPSVWAPSPAGTMDRSLTVTGPT